MICSLSLVEGSFQVWYRFRLRSTYGFNWMVSV